MPLFQYRLHDSNSIGVEYLTQTTSEHVKKAKSLELRMQNAKNALIVLEDVEALNRSYYETRKDEFLRLRSFLIKHNQYLEKNDFIGLIKQNFSPFYKKIKTKKARLMDLIFVLIK